MATGFHFYLGYCREVHRTLLERFDADTIDVLRHWIGEIDIDELLRQCDRAVVEASSFLQLSEERQDQHLAALSPVNRASFLFFVHAFLMRTSELLEHAWLLIGFPAHDEQAMLMRAGELAHSVERTDYWPFDEPNPLAKSYEKLKAARR